MNRVTAVTTALATATMAAAATISPAMAAPRATTAHPAASVKTVPASTAKVKAVSFTSSAIASELDGGKYVTVVRCHGVDSPPPIHLGGPGTPLTVSGTGPSAAVFKLLKQQDPYKDIYACTVVVEEKVPPVKPALPKRVAAHRVRPWGCEIATGRGTSSRCTKNVTLNTGFGGLARQVKNHRPAG